MTVLGEYNEQRGLFPVTAAKATKLLGKAYLASSWEAACNKSILDSTHPLPASILGYLNMGEPFRYFQKVEGNIQVAAPHFLKVIEKEIDSVDKEFEKAKKKEKLEATYNPDTAVIQQAKKQLADETVLKEDNITDYLNIADLKMSFAFVSLFIQMGLKHVPDSEKLKEERSHADNYCLGLTNQPKVNHRFADISRIVWNKDKIDECIVGKICSEKGSKDFSLQLAVSMPYTVGRKSELTTAEAINNCLPIENLWSDASTKVSANAHISNVLETSNEVIGSLDGDLVAIAPNPAEYAKMYNMLFVSRF